MCRCQTEVILAPCIVHCGHNIFCCLFRRVSDGKAGVTVEDNPAYGLNHSHETHRETKDEYEYIQSSPAAPQETVYEGVF